MVRASGERYDALLFHTQTVSLFAPSAARGGRYVVSLDATPVQVDEMGSWYRHRRSARSLEAAKAAWYRHVFRGAAAFVTWSHWAADSLARDYRTAGRPVLVAHPGAGEHFFQIPRPGPSRRRPRILFVGGDFARKGGNDLLAAFAPLATRAELVLVTEQPVAPAPGVTVLHDIRPGTSAQLHAFADADIFCLPTYGDCTPVAIGEAMAAGLPVVTTSVGSNSESLPDAAGRLVAPGDVVALETALRDLVEDAALRERMSRAARAHAREHMDAARNASRILDLLAGVA
jgi:glycosyltransferase involved in cell wall biosynthesis